MDPNHALSDDEKEALRRKRHLGLRKLGSLGLLVCGVCLLAIIIGLASIAIQVDSGTPYAPYVIGLAMIAGVTMLPAGIFAMLAARKGVDEQEVSSSVRCYVIIVFVICIASTTVCMFAMAVGGALSIAFCIMEYNGHLCQANHDGNLALSVLTLLISLALFVLSIMGSCFFCSFGRTLGFKSKYKRRMGQRHDVNAGHASTRTDGQLSVQSAIVTSVQLHLPQCTFRYPYCEQYYGCTHKNHRDKKTLPMRKEFKNGPIHRYSV